MMPLRPSKGAMRAMHYQRYMTSGRRCFTSSSVAAAVSPHRFSAQKRSQSTATAATTKSRPAPSPAFNLEPQRSEVSPLQNRNVPELDDSFVGLSGGEIFHEMMLRLGVKHVFGYPGGAILPVFDAIYNSKHFDFILPRHEQGAGHMAEGYARASGKPGVVLVTSGPGATNVITPMQDALSDGTPMVVFCGQVPTSAIGTDSFQEADVIGISRACTKWNVMVKSVAELPRRIHEAFEIATSAIPMNSTIPSLPSAASIAARELGMKQLESTIGRVARLVNVAKKPVLYVGQGLLANPEGPKLLKELADKACIPEADLIIAVGARFDDRVTGNITKFAPQAKLAASENRGGIVHFEIMPKNINKVVQANEAVEGDCAENISRLLPHVNKVSERPEWFAQINDWKARFPFSLYEKQAAEGPIKPQTLIEKLSDLTAHMKDRTLIATGVGQHQMWAAQHFRWRHPRSMITSGGLGTMGYGLPAAIGAKVACPDALVVDIDGDASFNMTLTELSTAAQFNIGVKVLLLNNEEQGMVTQWQNLFYEDRYSHTHQKNPDFVPLAQSMGVAADKLVNPAEMEEKLKWLIESDGPALLEVITDRKVPVLPMVPAGSALHEFLVYDEAKEQERKALMRKRKVIV
ncbi:acetolactate synthase catalytic subunit [Aspergillus arachidicola]|uniref:Acetolactate synthase catalytic subunit n=1 Tax=Aspergillus arachidicola TaxID=656916 RepID=A0A2G7G3J1_9EURO|nr:acetolactate synthase catalytic subunit [Aspergillus arachidicola]